MNPHRAEAEQFQSRLFHRETDCHEEKQAALRFTSQNMSLTTGARHFETLKHNELQTAQLRKSFDHNRSTLLEYLAQDIAERLQWEENECFQRLRAEEMQHDDLVTGVLPLLKPVVPSG